VATARIKPRRAAALALAVPLAVAGCGTGGATPGATAAPSPTVASAALALQEEFVRTIDRVGPSVVVIETANGLGSGVVFDAKGDIVTNAHVVAGNSSFAVTLADGQRLDGTLVGTFPGDDLAVIRVVGSNLHPATFGDASKLAVGDIVLAAGNPLGLQSSVTEGIVSALGRTVSEPGGAALPNVIQTSAAINPGNSGGALVDLAGSVVGIPTLAALDPQLGGAAPGIGFAIPSNVAVDIAGQLISYGRVVDSHRAYLGVQAIDVNGAPGAVVYSVQAGSPASQVGILRGDAVTKVDGRPTPTAEDLATVLADLKPGQSVPVSIVHPDRSKATVTATLGELPG
jgi:S1-C subfamily serine protease